MSTTAERTSRPTLLWVNAAVAALVVVAAVLLVVVAANGASGVTGSSGKDTRSSRAYDAVRTAANDEALAFMKVDYRDMDALMKKVLAGATGQFKKEYQRSSPQLKSAVVAEKSTSSGKVLSVGVSSLDTDSAVVFVAADSKVSNTGTKGKKVPRYYRLQMDLAKVKGAWLVKKLQFVG